MEDVSEVGQTFNSHAALRQKNVSSKVWANCILITLRALPVYPVVADESQVGQTKNRSRAIKE